MVERWEVTNGKVLSSLGRSGAAAGQLQMPSGRGDLPACLQLDTQRQK